MKRINLLLILMILLPFCMLAQNSTWAVKAVVKKGEALPVNVYLEDGTAVPVFALSEKVGVTTVNLSILKQGKVKAIRFSTLDSICLALDCQPGDILEYVE